MTNAIKRIMHALKLTKIAAVDRPCQEGAVAAIIKAAVPADVEAFLKREPNADAIAKGNAMADGSFAIADAADLAKAIAAAPYAADITKAKAHIRARAIALKKADAIPASWDAVAMIAKALAEQIKKFGPGENGDAETFSEALVDQISWDGYWKASDALRNSIQSIVSDDAVTDKQAMIQQSLTEFQTFMLGLFGEQLGKSLAAGFAADAGAAGPTGNGEHMTDAIKKALGLPATATEAEMLTAIAKRDADAALAALPAEQFAFYKKLAGDDAAAFLKMDDAGKKKKMKEDEPDADDVEKSLKAGDAFKTPEGAIMTKRDFGTPAGFLFAKGQNAKLIQHDADIAKRAESDAAADFAKRAKDLGFDADFGATIRKAYAGDAPAQAELEKRIGAMQKAINEGGLFTEFGKRNQTGGTAEGELLAKVEAIRKAEPALTYEQAYSKAYTDPANRDIRKRMADDSASQ